MSTTVQTTGTGSVYIQNLAFTGNSIIATNENGSVNFVPNGTGVIGFGDVGFNNGAISTTLENLDLVLSPDGTGTVKTDNLQLDGNTISTTDTDGDLLLAPNGNGTVKTGNLQLTGNTISTTDTDGDLLLAPNGNGNVGIGTSSPTAKLDVSGLIKTDHLSLGIHQYPNVGGQWLTINLNTYNGNAGPNAPEPEGGIMFSNIDGNSIFKWGYYMGVVKPSASDQSNSQRLDIGRTIDVESQISGGTAGTFIPSVTVFNDKVGIGTTNPSTKLEVNGYQTFYDSTLLPAWNTTGSNLVPCKIILGNSFCPQIRTFYPNNGYTDAIDLEFWTSGQNIPTDNTSSRLTIKAQSGNVGIGTTTPYAKLHVTGAGTSDALTAAVERYFHYGTGIIANGATTRYMYDVSIYCSHGIVSSSYILSHGSSSFSDKRIKENIVDIEDDQCLQKLRLIKPKQYTYKNTIEKGTVPVWGFIAQEVASVMDYAVDKMQKAIPNVYKLASVSEDGTVLTFDEPVTLEATNKLQLKTFVSEELDVTVSQVLSSTSVSLTEPLKEEHHTGIIGDESINGKVFVYGQYVKDFHVLKKDAIFTVGIAALQEVDRRQVADNERILELEGELALVKEENNLLKQQLDSILGRLSAAGL